MSEVEALGLLTVALCGVVVGYLVWLTKRYR